MFALAAGAGFLRLRLFLQVVGIVAAVAEQIAPVDFQNAVGDAI